MVLSEVVDNGGTIQPIFASRYNQTPLPRYLLPEHGISAEAAYQLVHDELMFDGNPRLNLASFVTTWMEPQCDKLVMESLNKNYIDMDEYPATVDLQDRCVNIIARLFNAPIKEGEQAVGTSTVGSSEAIMLAGLAFKRLWQNKRKQEGKPFDKPNIVTGANVQVCWEKFARYFEVELKEVKLKEGYYVMDPHKAVDLVDENTICVCAILGSTYNGEFEDIQLLNELLVMKNSRTGWNTPIHVDAASGGFVAPFLYPDLQWDFRLPLVRSINVSGHKYGLVYAGIGWVVWRSKEDLPDELVFHINYLGADQPTFTLNFSRGASQIVAQYYQFLRLGFKGYKAIISGCQANAHYLADKLEETGRYKLLSKREGVPVVAFSLAKPRGAVGATHVLSEYEVANRLRRHGWIVPAYTMAPNAEHVKLLRVVVREDLSRGQAEKLFQDIEAIVMDPHEKLATVPEAINGAAAPAQQLALQEGYQSEGGGAVPARRPARAGRPSVLDQFNRFRTRRESHKGPASSSAAAAATAAAAAGTPAHRHHHRLRWHHHRGRSTSTKTKAIC